MSVVEIISNKIGDKITKNLKLDNDSKEIIIYGTFTLLHSLACILSIVIFGAIFNVLLESIIICICVSLLRKYSGGVHATSPNRCLIMGTVVVVVLSIIVKNIFLNTNTIALLAIVSIIVSYYIIYKHAPVDSEAKPIEKISTKKKFKKYSITILTGFTIIMLILFECYSIFRNIVLINIINCIYIGILWQSFTLTNTGHIVIRKLDGLLGKIFKF